MNSDHQISDQAGIPALRVMDIELLALDLNTCTRCTGTLTNIEKAIETLHPVLAQMGVQIHVNKTVVTSEKEARQHRFTISPTVRINGQDIVFETIENQCDTCTNLCGCDEGTTCRIWPYQGKKYTEEPVGLVVESILRAIFGNTARSEAAPAKDEEVPENLKRFFDGMAAKQITEKSCCSAADQETCCEPEQKAACCDHPETETCGCR